MVSLSPSNKYNMMLYLVWFLLQEARHQALLRKREATSQKAGRRMKLERQQSYLGDCR